MAKKATTTEAPKASNGEAKEKPPLTQRECNVLNALIKHGSLGRAELKVKSGINSGLSNITGATTKDDGGAAGDEGLIARGLIRTEKHEDERGLQFSITQAGRKLAEKANKMYAAK